MFLFLNLDLLKEKRKAFYREGLEFPTIEGYIADLDIEFQDDGDVWDVSDLDEWSVEKIGG